MATLLKADNRSLINDSKYSFLTDNYAKNVASLVVDNTDGALPNGFAIIGNIGSKNTELRQIRSVSSPTGTIDFLFTTDTAVAGTTTSTIVFTTVRQYLDGMPVYVYDPTLVLRGSSFISASVNSNSFTLDTAITGTTPGDIVVVGDLTSFSHPESTKISYINYNVVKFFHTDLPTVPVTTPISTLTDTVSEQSTSSELRTITAPVSSVYTTVSGDPSKIITIDVNPPLDFSGALAITGYIPLDVSNLFTTYQDDVRPTGYGWFYFFNTTTLLASQPSNPIPYAGFDYNSVDSIFKAAMSSLNNKELKLITVEDQYQWINEAYTLAINELNLINLEYAASEDLKLTIKAGTAEYLLPLNFGSLLYVLDYRDIAMENYDATFERPGVGPCKYYLRGNLIGFDPLPNVDTTVTIGYSTTSPKVSKLDNIIDLPYKMGFILKDYILHKAYEKLGNTQQSDRSLKLFNMNVDKMKIYSIQRSGGLDSWNIAYTANV